MTKMSATTANPTSNACSTDEDALIESLRGLWVPHRRKDLEVRHEMGKLLNDRLGPPRLRQAYGQAVIDRVSKELDLDKTDISRMRRFAGKFKNFEAFQQKHPETTSWTRVRVLISKPRDLQRVADNRRARGVLRSLRSSIKSLRGEGEFRGSIVDDIRSALHELCEVAQATIQFQLED